jgi:hypothetical protein
MVAQAVSGQVWCNPFNIGNAPTFPFSAFQEPMCLPWESYVRSPDAAGLVEIVLGIPKTSSASVVMVFNHSRRPPAIVMWSFKAVVAVYLTHSHKHCQKLSVVRNRRSNTVEPKTDQVFGHYNRLTFDSDVVYCSCRILTRWVLGNQPAQGYARRHTQVSEMYVVGARLITQGSTVQS